MAACKRVIWVSKDVSCCLHNGFCLCWVFWVSLDFYLERGFTLCYPLSHVVKNSCPMGCLKPQLVRPLVTEVVATKGSLGDRDLEKKNLASATMLWPFHRWSAWLLLCFISLNVFQRGNLEGGSNSMRIVRRRYSLGWSDTEVKRNTWEAIAGGVRHL